MLTAPPAIERPLSHLATGSRARVVRIEGDDALAHRLRDLGFWTGTEVEVRGRAPFAGPRHYGLRGYHLALRRAEADRVVVVEL